MLLAKFWSLDPVELMLRNTKSSLKLHGMKRDYSHRENVLFQIPFWIFQNDYEVFSGSIPNSLQVSISSEYVDSWKKLRNYNKLQKKSSRKFILRCYQQIMNPRIAFKLGVAVTQGGKCQEAKFYDVNSVSKRSCCRKSCKFASFLGSQQFSWEKKGNHYDVTKR